MSDFTAEHDQFAFDDAAYLLGALEPAEHAAFERHLATCPICHQSVEELAGLPAVLEQVDPSSLETLETEPVPESLLPRLLAQVNRHRARRTLRTATTGFLVACLLAALGFGGVRYWSDTHRPQTLVMQAVGPDAAGIYGTVRLLGDGADTRIQIDCGYHNNSAAPYPGEQEPSYRMLVFNQAGMMRDLGSWSPQPGEDVEITRDSPWRRQALSRVEVATTTGEVVLRLVL
ncbi:MAG: anti-sigma factor family protein [Jatrophihabitantaceae bacterium]